MAQKFRSAVHLFFFDKEGRTLLSHRCNTGYMDGWYSLVAGHIEPGETVRQAAIREAREEAGVELASEDIDVVGVMHRKDGEERIDFFVFVRAWQGDPTNQEPHKCDGLDWFSPDQMPENLVPYIHQAFHNLYNQQWFDTFGFED